MPDKRNNQREQHMNDMEIPYENIYPPLKYLYINEKEREKLPDYYDLLDIPEYSKTYFKEQLGTEIIPFYYQPIKEADFESFILWTGWIYASDKNNVYILFRYDVPMLDIDILNYKVFEKNGIIQYPFYNIIKGANSKEGNKINNPFYLVQNNGVRYKGIKLTEINPFNKIIYH
ncbi:MAG: hypothetical protein LBH96_00705 [Candidatus Peribacteria bacterium]|jgi:hypothetical protein|nr:hypothetical protein [Candidatus Peribacteria bacterium]